MSDTPRTDDECYYPNYDKVDADFARKLERELATVTEQRDRLAEVLNDLWHNYSLTGAAYELIEKALAAVKGEHQ
jgi:hypothetical protein